MNMAARIIDLHRREDGLSPAQIAERLGTTRKCVNATLYRWRERGCVDAKPVGRPKAEVSAVNVLRPAQNVVDRIQREVAAGKRCQKCWLLLPCDHG